MTDWTVRLADHAAQDVEEILDWTLDHFGPLQLEVYTETINDALEALTEGFANLGVRERPELGKDLATLHVARKGRNGRHQLIVRFDEAERTIEVLRILHDSMDIARHIPSAATE